MRTGLAISGAAFAFSLILNRFINCPSDKKHQRNQNYYTNKIHAIPPTIMNASALISHATTHWNITSRIAHLPPSSLLIEAIAAMHGV